jgi:hypothetical protein
MTRPLLCAAVSFLGAYEAAAQTPSPSSTASTSAISEPPRKGGNVIKIAPLGWIHGSLPFTVESRIGYERRIGPRSSLMGSYSYLGTNYPFSFIGSFALSAAISTAITYSGHPAIGWTDAKIRAEGHRWQLQYRKYLSKRRLSPEGWYLAPQFSYAKVRYDVILEDFDVDVGIDVTNRNYNLLFGHQRVFGRHFVFDIFTGMGYRDKTTALIGDDGARLDYLSKGSKFKLSSGLNIGWAF